jgi:polysaccharide export outer membrane protein
MQLTRCTALVVTALAMPAFAAAQTAADSATPPVQVASSDLSSPTTALRPGDVLRLKIWREPDLSGDFTVDESGMATLPRLGPTSVIGVPSNQLRDQLVEKYRQYLNNPSIEITPLRRVSILGSVQKPGIYPLEPSIRLGDAANVAGGVTSESKRNNVELTREGKHYNYDLRADPEKANLSLASGDQVYVPQRSWLSRNATWFVSTLVAVGGTAALLIAR